MDRFEQIIAIRRALKDVKFKEEIPVVKGDKPVDVQEAENIKKNGNPIDLAAYPWDECIADQIKTYGDKATAEAVCGAIKAQNMREDFVIPDPSGDEDEQTFIGRCVSAIYDEYGDKQSYAICKSKWDEK